MSKRPESNPHLPPSAGCHYFNNRVKSFHSQWKRNKWNICQIIQDYQGNSVGNGMLFFQLALEGLQRAYSSSSYHFPPKTVILPQLAKLNIVEPFTLFTIRVKQRTFCLCLGITIPKRTLPSNECFSTHQNCIIMF